MRSVQALLSAAAVFAFLPSFAVQVAQAGPTPDFNVKLSYPYPANDYTFQDRRSIHDILAGRMPEELANAGDPEDTGPAAFCFDPDFPPSQEVMAQINQLMTGVPYSTRYNIGGRWARGSTGEPIALTWSFVPDGTAWGDAGFPGGQAASSLFATMDSRFGGSANRATWILQFQRSFDRWQAVSGVTYTRIQSGSNPWDDGAAWGNAGSAARGDVRIGMHNIDGANGILAYNVFPDNGDMMIDSSENWASGATSYVFLRNVIMHEHGHGLGFNHVCPQGTANQGAAKLMAPFASTSFDGPQQDDIRAVQENYGDPFEPNNNSASAHEVGPLTAGTTNTLGVVPSPTPTAAAVLSIDAASEQDWYKYSVTVPRLVNVTLTPVGSTYASSPQDNNCVGTGATINALAAADLNFEIRNASGTIFWRQAAAAAAGLPESITGLLVSPAGDFFVRVYTVSGTFVETQSYRLAVLAQNVNLAPSASDGTFTDKVRITWPGLVTDATNYQITRNTTDLTSGSVQVGQVAGGTLTFDDTTAVPGVTYYYFVRAQQPGNVGYRFMTANGDPGFRLNSNTPPTANAGNDQVVEDSDRDGSVVVTLDGSGSTDAGGSITNYLWQDGPTTLANGPSPTANVVLPVGAYTITLTVTDNGGLTASDTVSVTVEPGCPADFNQDGGVDGADIESFFGAFEQGTSEADVNGDGGVDGADVESFFIVWGNGGC